MAGATLWNDHREGEEMNAWYVIKILLFWLVAGVIFTWWNYRTDGYLERKNAQWKAKFDRKRWEEVEVDLNETRRQ